MQPAWRLSNALADMIIKLFEEVGLGVPGAPHIPCIMWSLEATVQHEGQVVRTIPPRYALGWVEAENLHQFKTITNTPFGRIVFHPRPEDEASATRLIDYDGTDIIVH